jgi:hypothetical protein
MILISIQAMTAVLRTPLSSDQLTDIKNHGTFHADDKLWQTSQVLQTGSVRIRENIQDVNHDMRGFLRELIDINFSRKNPGSLFNIFKRIIERSMDIVDVVIGVNQSGKLTIDEKYRLLIKQNSCGSDYLIVRVQREIEQRIRDNPKLLEPCSKETLFAVILKEYDNILEDNNNDTNVAVMRFLTHCNFAYEVEQDNERNAFQALNANKSFLYYFSYFQKRALEKHMEIWRKENPFRSFVLQTMSYVGLDELCNYYSIVINALNFPDKPKPNIGSVPKNRFGWKIREYVRATFQNIRIIGEYNCNQILTSDHGFAQFRNRPIVGVKEELRRIQCNIENADRASDNGIIGIRLSKFFTYPMFYAKGLINMSRNIVVPLVGSLLYTGYRINNILVSPLWIPIINCLHYLITILIFDFHGEHRRDAIIFPLASGSLKLIASMFHIVRPTASLSIRSLISIVLYVSIIGYWNCKSVYDFLIFNLVLRFFGKVPINDTKLTWTINYRHGCRINCPCQLCIAASKFKKFETLETLVKKILEN